MFDEKGRAEEFWLKIKKTEKNDEEEMVLWLKGREYEASINRGCIWVGVCLGRTLRRTEHGRHGIVRAKGSVFIMDTSRSSGKTAC